CVGNGRFRGRNPGKFIVGAGALALLDCLRSPRFLRAGLFRDCPRFDSRSSIITVMPGPPIYVGGTAGEVLRAARVDSRLTQRQLAERAGITQPVVAAYETGRRQPTIPMLRRLLAAADHNLAVTAVPKTVTSDERTR